MSFTRSSAAAGAQSAAQAGFTLIEVMAVMLIVAMVASLVIATTPGDGRAQLHALTLQTASMLRRERHSAILTGRARAITLDGPQRALIGDGGERLRIPADVQFDLLGADQIWAGRRAVVRFEPDGASTGAVLRLSREQAIYEISVNWYTGGVAVNP